MGVIRMKKLYIGDKGAFVAQVMLGRHVRTQKTSPFTLLWSMDDWYGFWDYEDCCSWFEVDGLWG
jgi:hypothetical protein